MKNNEITKRCIGRMQFESEILALLCGTHRTPAWSGAPRCSECSWTHWPPKALPCSTVGIEHPWKDSDEDWFIIDNIRVRSKMSQDTFLLKHSSDGPSSSRMPPQELHKDQQCFPAHLTHESKIACMACTYGILHNGVQSNSLNTQANQGSSGIDLKKRDTAVALSPPSSLSLNLHAWTVYKLSSRSTTNVDLPLTRTVATRARIQTSAPMAGLIPSSPKVFTLTKEWQATQQTGWCRKHQ